MRLVPPASACYYWWHHWWGAWFEHPRDLDDVRARVWVRALVRRVAVPDLAWYRRSRHRQLRDVLVLRRRGPARAQILILVHVREVFTPVRLLVDERHLVGRLILQAGVGRHLPV